MRKVLIALVMVLMCMPAFGEDSAPFVIEARIPLGEVEGRIDHLAIDLAHQRLFVAELGNDTVGVVDLQAGKTTRRLEGFDEPQGLAYAASTQTLYVANGGDGSLRMFRGVDLTPAGTLELGSDADNVRIDTERARVYVGYGNGSLAVIDQATAARLGDIPLHGHPESFQLEAAGPRIFVNVPDAREIAVVDRVSQRQIAAWPTEKLRANYPMAIDEARHRLLSVFRSPPTLVAFDIADGSGKVVSTVPVCGDADDVFVDSKRRRIYVACGEGMIDVLAENEGKYTRVAQLKTVSGARTALFSPVADRLFVAVRARGGQPAAIWVLRPVS